MSFFHIHSTVIQNEKQKFLTEKPVFQTLSCLVWRVCVFPPYGIWGGIAIYVREWLEQKSLGQEKRIDGFKFNITIWYVFELFIYFITVNIIKILIFVNKEV